MFGADEIAALIIVLLGYAAFLIWSKRRRRRKATSFFVDDNTPLELQQSTLYGSETRISCIKPVALGGIYDQLYQTPANAFILTDTKTRNKPYVYESDLIQLSAYKVILENSIKFNNRHIANYGYMRLVCNGVTHYKKVDLMTEEDVVALYERREALYAGTTEPHKADTPGKCIKCHQLTHCGGVKGYKKRGRKPHNSGHKKSFSGWD